MGVTRTVAVLVIGAGPEGYPPGQLGKKVSLVERDRLVGEYLNASTDSAMP